MQRTHPKYVRTQFFPCSDYLHPFRSKYFQSVYFLDNDKQFCSHTKQVQNTSCTSLLLTGQGNINITINNNNNNDNDNDNEW